MQNKVTLFPNDDLNRITTLTTYECSRSSYGEATRASSYYASASDAGDTCCSIPTPRLLRKSVARHHDWREDRTATNCRRALRGKRCNVFTGLAVTVALYFPDLWVLFQVETNFILDVILTVVLVIFIIEITCLSLTDASYPFGFFFWTDCVGTATLVLDISYLSGADDPGRHNLTVIRAAHVSKIGSRIGRGSRIMKLLSYIILSGTIDHKKKAKRVISKQLTNIIATRIASTAIWLILVLPLFYEYSYPTEDGSMAAWTRLLGEDVTTYTTAADAEDTSAAETAWANLQTRFQHFTSFYDDMNYGPCEACIGTLVGSGFRCDLGIQLDSSFSCPGRQSSLGQFSYGKLQTGFDMSYCSRLRSAGNLVSVTIAVVLMTIFGFVTSYSVNIVAVVPLERMLRAVRQRCKQIFRYANSLVPSADVLQGNEFAILEQVIAKLSSIATVSLLMRRRTTARVSNVHENVFFDYMENMPFMAEAVKEGGTNWPDSDLFVEEDSWKSIDIGVAGMLRARRRIPQHTIDQLDTEEFFAWKLKKGELRASVATYIAQNAEGSRLWAQINIPDVHLWKFMQVIESRYTEHPYHNSAHAVDVEYSVFRYMSLIGAHKFMSEMTQFWLLIAAISHDVEHTGLTNSYLIETSHQLALKYNDRSPLENMHCTELFQVISNPETNIFIQLEKWQYKEIRKGLISAILHTDNMFHGELLRDLGLLYEMNTEAFLDLDSHPEVFKDTKDVQLIVDSLLHTADVGNPMKPWDLAAQLAHKTLEEFFIQGDLEKEHGIPVQALNDRNKVIIPTSQIGFMEMMVAPLCQSMVQLFPPLDNLATNLANNIQAWRNEWVEQFSPLEDEVMKTDARVEKVVLDCFSLKQSSAKRRTTVVTVSNMTRNTRHDKKQFSELKE